MDKLSSHRTKKMLDYYSQNNLNIIFKCVYKLNFNAVELAFKNIKFHLYKNLYENIENAFQDVKNIITDKKFDLVLKHNFSKILSRYLEYCDKNKYINLNNLKI